MAKHSKGRYLESKIKIGIVQMSMTRGVNDNIRKALEGVNEAAREGAQIACLPELFGWRYFPSTRGAKEEPQRIPGLVSRALSDCARKNRVVVIGGSVYEVSGNKKYNTCLVYNQNGRLLSKYRKVHVPQDEHYYEQDYFSSGDKYVVARTDVGSVGAMICFDQWYPEAARVNRLMGAEILVYPTAVGWVKGIEPVEGDWKQAWEAVQVGHAIANSVVVCAVNRVGTEGKTTFWGGSFVCDQFGKILFRAGSEEGVFLVECDLGLGNIVEDGWGFMRNRQSNTYSSVTKR
jgi:agmatine deiminase